MPQTAEEKAAWRATQKAKVHWRVHRLPPTIDEKGVPVTFAPRRGGVAATCVAPDAKISRRQLKRLRQTVPTGYIVGPKGNFQRLDRLMAAQWNKMTPEEREQFLEEAKARKEAE